MNSTTNKTNAIFKVFTAFLGILVLFGTISVAGATSYPPIDSSNYYISLSPSTVTFGSTQNISITFNQVISESIGNLSLAVYDSQHNLVSDERLSSLKFIQTQYPLAQTDVMCYPIDYNDYPNNYISTGCGGNIYATQFNTQITNLISRAGVYSMYVHNTYTNGYANSLRGARSNTVYLTVNGVPAPVQNELTISTTDSLTHQAYTPATIAFTIDNQYGYGQTEFNTSRGQTIPGMSFTEGYAPCAPGNNCTQNFVSNTLFLSGTPTAPGTYRIIIDVTKTFYPQCGAPIDSDIAPVCEPTVQHGTRTFTITIARNRVVEPPTPVTYPPTYSYPVSTFTPVYNYPTYSPTYNYPTYSYPTYTYPTYTYPTYSYPTYYYPTYIDPTPTTWSVSSRVR